MLNMSQKLICYYKPLRWHTLDDWELEIVEIPEEQSVLEVKHGNAKFKLHLAYDYNEQPIKIKLRPGSHGISGSAGSAPAGALEIEMWEPLAGWRATVGWSLGNNGKPPKTDQ